MSLTIGSAPKHPVVLFGYTSPKRARVSERAERKVYSGSGTEDDGRQMLKALLVIDDKRERCAWFSAQLDSRGCRVGPSCLEARSISRWPELGTDLIRSATAKGLVGSPAVVPMRIRDDLFAHSLEFDRHEDSPKRFGFEGENESLCDGNGALATQGAKAGLGAMLRTPIDVVGTKLHASVGDDVLGCPTGARHSGVEETEHLRGARFLRKDINGNQSSRKVIDDNGDVPGERPEGGQSERKPG